MTLARIRVAFCSALAALLAIAWTAASGQAPPAGRETSAASVASYALSQQMPVDPEVAVGTLRHDGYLRSITHSIHPGIEARDI